MDNLSNELATPAPLPVVHPSAFKCPGTKCIKANKCMRYHKKSKAEMPLIKLDVKKETGRFQGCLDFWPKEAPSFFQTIAEAELQLSRP